MSAVSNSLDDRLAKIEQQQLWQSIEILKSKHDINLLQGKKTVIIDSSLAGSKAIVKLGSKEIAFQMGKIISVDVGKITSKEVAKVIPFVSLVAGVGLCVFRVIKGVKSGNKMEFVKAPLEIVSGVLACFPGVGTISSVALDGGLLSWDIYNDLHPKDKFTLNDCYKSLNIEEESPSKETVDKAYHNFANNFHPDKDSKDSEKQEEFTDLMKYINTCKETIYKERGWSSGASSEGVK